MHIAPYVSEQKRKRQKRRKYFLIAAGVVLLGLIGWATWWFIFRSPVFRVENIVVQGNSSVASSDIETLVNTDISNSHTFFDNLLGTKNMLVWPTSLSASDVEQLPQLASISIAKDYFSHTITITATEREPFGIWCFLSGGGSSPQAESDASSKSDNTIVNADTTSTATSTISTTSSIPAIQTNNGNCYWFDNQGVLFEKATNTEGNLIYVVDDYSQQPRDLNQKILPDEFVENFISIMNTLHAIGIGVQEIDLRDLSLEEVHAVLAQGPVIYFSLRFPANDYTPVIQNIATQSDFAKLQYIDCRTEDRVFYK